MSAHLLQGVYGTGCFRNQDWASKDCVVRSRAGHLAKHATNTSDARMNRFLSFTHQVIQTSQLSGRSRRANLSQTVQKHTVAFTQLLAASRVRLTAHIRVLTGKHRFAKARNLFATDRGAALKCVIHIFKDSGKRTGFQCRGFLRLNVDLAGQAVGSSRSDLICVLFTIGWIFAESATRVQLQGGTVESIGTGLVTCSRCSGRTIQLHLSESSAQGDITLFNRIHMIAGFFNGVTN
mmetsp:Transcript_2617/g.8217  ORF Transcript_2617/g.8217 Transcript_2617/m.8217 type:complete len:236 (-) Transcript_2617:1326-2033(-)